MSDNAINTAIQYLKQYLNIDNTLIYQEHIPYMIEYKNILYSEDINTTTAKETVYSKMKDDNGISKLKQELKYKKKYLLKPQLQICKEFASYMFNEKIDFKVSENEEILAENEINYLKKHYTDTCLWENLENQIVDVFGIGTVGVVSSYDEVWGIQNTFYDAYCILPITIINNKIKEAAFIGTDIIDKTKTRISLHRINWKTENYIDNNNIKLYSKKAENGYIIDTVTLDKNGRIVKEESRFGRISPIRLFAIFKPFNRKSYNYANCFGIPIYLDSMDIVTGIDDTYNAMRNDLAISENMLLANKNLFEDPITGVLNIPDKYNHGNVILLGEENANSIENKSVVSIENLTTKISEYSKNLNEEYRLLSQNVGLGSETLSLNKISTPTATQVISDNNQKFTSLKKHFGQMRDEIAAFNSSILYLAYENTPNKNLNYNTKITFNTGDSILVDDETLKEKALMDYQAGVMSVYRYLSEYEKLSGTDLIDELDRLGYDEKGIKKQLQFDFGNTFNDDNNKDDDNLDKDKAINE